jgi:type IV pilus assembly protein PilV
MNKNRSTRLQAGLSMVEVLVALVIFAFGLLGAAGLQLNSLKANQFSVSASGAVTLAREYGDLMRLMITDPEAATSTVTLSDFLLDTSSTRTSMTPAACNGMSITCNPSDLAKAAIDDWVLRVRNTNDVKSGLVGGRAEICHTSDPRDSAGDMQWGGCDGSGDTVVTKIGWFSKRSGTSDAADSQAWLTADRPKMSIATFYVPPDWAKGL